jgi:hypothetical protein
VVKTAYHLRQAGIFGGIVRAHVFRSLVLTLLLAVGALGQTPGDRTFVREEVFVVAGQQVRNATCLFCSVQVEGDLTGHVFVLFGNLNVSGQVRGNATVIWGNVVVDSQARIGGDTLVLGGNAVYETDESLVGSAYVVGGHLSHVPRASAQKEIPSRVSLGPLYSGLIGVVVLLLLSVMIVPRVRRGVAVNQPS